MSEGPEIEESPLSAQFTRDGVTVEVKIHRVTDGAVGWSLEVIMPDGTNIAWKASFPSDSAAFRAFYLAVENYGMGTLLDIVRKQGVPPQLN